jgi:hypothetical protein
VAIRSSICDGRRPGHKARLPLLACKPCLTLQLCWLEIVEVLTKTACGCLPHAVLKFNLAGYLAPELAKCFFAYVFGQFSQQK